MLLHPIRNAGLLVLDFHGSNPIKSDDKTTHVRPGQILLYNVNTACTTAGNPQHLSTRTPSLSLVHLSFCVIVLFTTFVICLNIFNVYLIVSHPCLIMPLVVFLHDLAPDHQNPWSQNYPQTKNYMFIYIYTCFFNLSHRESHTKHYKAVIHHPSKIGPTRWKQILVRISIYMIWFDLLTFGSTF